MYISTMNRTLVNSLREEEIPFLNKYMFIEVQEIHKNCRYITELELAIYGYVMFTRNMWIKSHRAVIIYNRCMWKLKEINTFTKFTESIWVKISLKCKKYVSSTLFVYMHRSTKSSHRTMNSYGIF